MEVMTQPLESTKTDNIQVLQKAQGLILYTACCWIVMSCKLHQAKRTAAGIQLEIALQRSHIGYP